MNLMMGREQWHSHEKSRRGEWKAGSNEWRSAERMPVMYEEGREGSQQVCVFAKGATVMSIGQV